MSSFTHPFEDTDVFFGKHRGALSESDCFKTPRDVFCELYGLGRLMNAQGPASQPGPAS